ncbi:MAG TPA: serine/threonine protein kinase, partial [Acidobacteria bacterium]|nr:serine/threonine protein kinase [Acidobacteriota bacterium]
MQAGQRIRDYVLVEKVGQGGMGEVWSAFHEILERQVAIKALASHISEDPSLRKRFLQEARSQAKIQHPRVLSVMDAFQEGGVDYLVMPLVVGHSLADRLAEARGPLPLGEALRLAGDVLDALDAAHRNGIIHRDVKPANLMLTGDGVVKILDFGLAKLAGTTSAARKETGGGTLAYMSPEQTLGEDVDGRADLWSLGVVLYEMLTGLKPFRADRDQGVLYAIRNTDPVPLPALCPEVPAALAELAGRLLAKDPA